MDVSTGVWVGDKKDLEVDPLFCVRWFLPFDYLSDEVPVEFQVRGVKSPRGRGGRRSGSRVTGIRVRDRDCDCTRSRSSGGCREMGVERN